MSQKFLFKLFVIIMMTLLLVIIVAPFVGAVFSFKQGSFKYGYTFLDLNLKAVFLVSLAIAMTIVVWNAFEFEKYPKLDMRQYMKPKQVYDILTSDPVTAEELKDSVDEITKMKGWKTINLSDTEATISRMNFLMKDRVTLQLMNDRIRITSRPKWKILLVDMARNYRNILVVSQKLKHLR